MRSSRLLGIVLHLQLRGRTTAADLAARFEVSRRTILRDVEQLSAAGVPVYTERGRDGGIALLDDYRTTLTGMTGGEAEALAFVSLPGAARQLGLAAELTTARNKLLAALPDDASTNVGRIVDRFHVDPTEWFRHVEEPSTLPALARAVWDGERVAVRHEAWGAEERTLDPLGLVVKAGTWYLVARRSAEPPPATGASLPGGSAHHPRPAGQPLRVLRVDRVTSVRPTGAAATRPDPGFRLAEVWERWREEYEAGLRIESATVLLTETGRAELHRLGTHLADHAVEVAPPDATGRSTVTLPVESIDNAVRDLMLLGEEVEVVEPAELRASIRRRALAIARAHGRRPGPRPTPDDGCVNPRSGRSG